jgi:hypothetical protein
MLYNKKDMQRRVAWFPKAQIVSEEGLYFTETQASSELKQRSLISKGGRISDEHVDINEAGLKGGMRDTSWN